MTNIVEKEVMKPSFRILLIKKMKIVKAPYEPLKIQLYNIIIVV